ncbi:flagellar basal body rod protein FlgC [bacterium]|nr:flagellar basal body rod protein FlgC [bacterium]
MDIFKTMDVVGSALSAERTRLNAIASNVANANTLKSADGSGPYKRKDVVLESVAHESEFGEILDEQSNTHTEVQVSAIVEDQSGGRAVYKPEHPEADAEGYVYYPNVNPVEEMANMVSADRAFQTNVNIFQTTKQMALKALEIGR